MPSISAFTITAPSEGSQLVDKLSTPRKAYGQDPAMLQQAPVLSRALGASLQYEGCGVIVTNIMIPSIVSCTSSIPRTGWSYVSKRPEVEELDPTESRRQLLTKIRPEASDSIPQAFWSQQHRPNQNISLSPCLSPSPKARSRHKRTGIRGLKSDHNTASYP